MLSRFLIFLFSCFPAFSSSSSLFPVESVPKFSSLIHPTFFYYINPFSPPRPLAALGRPSVHALLTSAVSTGPSLPSQRHCGSSICRSGSLALRKSLFSPPACSACQLYPDTSTIRPRNRSLCVICQASAPRAPSYSASGVASGLDLPTAFRPPISLLACFLHSIVRLSPCICICLVQALLDVLPQSFKTQHPKILAYCYNNNVPLSP